MNAHERTWTRRRFVKNLAIGAAAFTVPGAFAEQLILTPPQTQGPFYPDKLPLDTDNDLLIVNDRITPAVGEITHLTGRVLDAKGNPLRNILVEIWQVDNNGVYLHTASPNRQAWDANFQGFGRFLTGANGDYYFRTIKPVPYGQGNILRTPHIHFALKAKGMDLFTTQCYINGHPQNPNDAVLRGIRDEKARQAVMVDFKPIPGSRIGELAARFDIVLGHTPELP